MDHDRISVEDTVNRYLRDELSADDAEAFEQHYLSCRQCLDELASTQALRTGLTGLVESGRLKMPARHRKWFTTPVWAAAAMVVLAVSLATNGVLLTKRDAAPIPASAEVFSLVTVRDASGEPVNMVVAAAATDMVVLVVDSGRLDDAGPFAATIVPETHPDDAFTLGPLTAGADGRIAVSVPVATLSTGIYRVDVSEHEASATLNSARFAWTPP